jgi:ABC-type nitrate/sulfonate/bicarbonate transport system substrate-binding protein
MSSRIVLALALMLAAADIAEAQPLQRVVVAYPSRSIGSIHSFIALERGFFREEGLDGQLVQVRGTAAVAATVSGDANALEAMGTAMGAIQRGAPLRILAVNLYKPLFWLATRPQLKTAHELNGKIMGTTTFGGVQHLTGLRMLRKLGVNPDTVTVIQVGDVPTQLQALVQGSIDIALLSPPTVIRARDQYKMNLLAGALNDFVGFQNGFAVLEASLSKDRALFKKMLRARAKANRYFWENERGTGEVLAKYVRVDLPIALESYRLSREAFAANGIPSEREINEVLKTDAEMLKIAEPLPSSKIFDFSLQREINKELGVK